RWRRCPPRSSSITCPTRLSAAVTTAVIRSKRRDSCRLTSTRRSAAATQYRHWANCGPISCQTSASATRYKGPVSYRPTSIGNDFEKNEALCYRYWASAGGGAGGGAGRLPAALRCRDGAGLRVRRGYRRAVPLSPFTAGDQGGMGISF